MVVQWINWTPPNPNGNFELGIEHVNGLQEALNNIETTKGDPGENGTNGLTYVNDPTKQLRVWKGRATLTGTNGVFQIDYSEANFTDVISVQAQILGGGQLQADFPVAVTIYDTYNEVIATGKAFKATSAGLLAAMQQTPAEPGTKVDIVVIGY